MLSELAVNASADAVARLLDGGTLALFDAADRLLATLRFSRPAFSPARAGVASARTIEPDPDAAASGTAAWYRLSTARGETVLEGTAGGPDAEDVELVLNSPEIRQGAEVSVEGYQLTARRK